MFRHQIETILTLDVATRDLFCGVYPMNQLPTRQEGAYVINMDDHDEPGSHWVAVFDNNGVVEYVDSYGYPPIDVRCLQFLGSEYYYNKVKLQKQYSNACGFYCIYYILKRARGLTANDIIRNLKRTNSDFVVKNFLYSHYKPVFN